MKSKPNWVFHMNKVVISPEARKDLSEIKEYISENLGSPQSAQNTVGKVMSKLRELEAFSGIGTPLSSIIDIETDYRFLVCENYLAFYRTEKNMVYVDRIIYKKRNYIGILFGE